MAFRSTVGAQMALFTLVALSACQTTNSTPQQVVEASPPAGAQIAEFNPPPVGATWTYDKDGEAEVLQRLQDGIFKDQAVIRIDVGDEKTWLYTTDSLNWVATLDVDNNPVTSATPSTGGFHWPLWVGKKWTSTFTFRDHKRGKSWAGGQTHWMVEAIEAVETPAGSFNTYRLQSEPGKHNATVQTVWYAPDLGIVVKQSFRRTSKHYRGEGGFEKVLVSFSRPSA